MTAAGASSLWINGDLFGLKHLPHARRISLRRGLAALPFSAAEAKYINELLLTVLPKLSVPLEGCRTELPRAPPETSQAAPLDATGQKLLICVSGTRRGQSMTFQGGSLNIKTITCPL